MEKAIIMVEGMACSHCVNTIKTSLTNMPGISNVSVDLNNKSVTVDFDPSQTTIELIKAEIEDQGYEVI